MYSNSNYSEKQEFPREEVGHISKPATIVDCEGRIIAWYLPGILLPARQASFNFLLQFSFAHAIHLERINEFNCSYLAKNGTKSER